MGEKEQGINYLVHKPRENPSLLFTFLYFCVFFGKYEEVGGRMYNFTSYRIELGKNPSLVERNEEKP